MNFTIIQNLLDEKLLTLTDAPDDIVLENSRVSVGVNKTWIRSTLLPNETENITLGLNGYQRLSGLYQIDIWTPADKGINTGSTLADAIVSLFSKGTVLSNTDGDKINIIKSWREKGPKEPGVYNTPVIVKWEAFNID